MASPRPIDYLQPDEPIIEQCRRHPLSAVDGFLGLSLLFAVIAAAGVLVAARVDRPVYVWSALTAISLAYLVAMTLLHWRRATSLYVLTPERVYGARGRVRFHLTQTTFDKVTDLHLRQSLFGRIWGYGTIQVQTAGTGLYLAGIADPIAFKQGIETQRRRFLATLVGEHRPVPRAEEAAAELLWEGTPSPASFLGNGLVAGFIGIVALGLLVAAVFVDAPVLLFGLGALVLASLILFGAWVQYRFTHYEVGSNGVAVRKGWITRRRVEATYAKVTDVAVNQDVLGRLFGYGTITINTAGSNAAPVVFSGLADPDAVKRIIDEAR